MKLTVFHAEDGDCLLLTSRDGHTALVDGGRARSFRASTWPVLRSMAEAGDVLDLVVVSHIDADHIEGILWLLEAVAAWTVYDYQREQGNERAKEPAVERPPTITKLWHNSWTAQVGDLAGPIQALADAVVGGLDTAPFDRSDLSEQQRGVLDAMEGLAESIPQGIALRRLVDDETPIVRNAPFDDLVLLRDPPHVERLGSAKLTVLGPSAGHLEALRETWRDWIADRATPRPADGPPTAPVAPGAGLGSAALGEVGLSDVIAADRARNVDLVRSLVMGAEVITTSRASRVTPPNRASITLLAREGKRSCLLTGDAAEDEILEGLEAAGELRDGRTWCNVVKVQHHGSEYNLSTGFAGAVLADHYVFCADGHHDNPDPSVVRTVIETRLGADPRPFTLWFNCSPERTARDRRTAMRAAIREATKAERAHPGIVSVEVLADDRHHLEIPV